MPGSFGRFSLSMGVQAPMGVANFCRACSSTALATAICSCGGCNSSEAIRRVRSIVACSRYSFSALSILVKFSFRST